MPSAHLTVFSDPDEPYFRQACAQRQGDIAMHEKYSDLTPETEEECVHRWLAGRWRPFWVLGGGTPLVWHYTHDMSGSDRSTWLHGYCYPDARGRSPEQEALRVAAWYAAYRHLTVRWGYREIFAYVLASSSGAIHWNEQLCRHHRVGVVEHAVPEGDELVPVIVYSHHESGISLAKVQADQLFPQGKPDWQAVRGEVFPEME